MKKVIGFFEGIIFALLAMLSWCFVFGVGEDILIINKKVL